MALWDRMPPNSVWGRCCVAGVRLVLLGPSSGSKVACRACTRCNYAKPQYVHFGSVPFPCSPLTGTTRHRPHPRHPGRQDRAQPPDERDPGGHGPGALQVLVRRLRPRPRQDGGPLAPRPSLLGLPADLYDLFPDRLVESELGEIPEGWEVRPFGELLTDTIGGDWGKEEPDEIHTEPVAIFRGTDLQHLRAGDVGDVPLRFTTPRKLERRQLQHGDLVIEVSGGSAKQPTGRSLFVSQPILDRFSASAVCASFCRRFRAKDIQTAVYAAGYLARLYDSGGTWGYQNQSTGIANFQTSYFLEAERLAWPGDRAIEAYSQQVAPALARGGQNEILALVALRDTLLPRLVSGELRVNEASQLVESTS